MGQVLHTDDWNAANRIKSAKLDELGYVAICLAPGEESAGHSHTLVEEVTIFKSGTGQIEIEDQCYEVCAGSVSIVPAGEFHCIKNTGSENLEAVIVFNSNIDRDQVVLKTREEHFANAPASAQAAEMQSTIAALCATVERLEKKLDALGS